MKRALAITIASAILAGAASVHAALNLVADPNFSGSETGTLVGSPTSSPWFDPSASGNTSINSSLPIAGSTKNAVLSVPGSGSAFLDQTISGLAAGTGYTISLWLADPTGTGLLTVHLGGITTTLTVPETSGYVDYNLFLTTANATAPLVLAWPTTASGALDVGQVSVAVPEPTTMVAGALMLLPFAASTLRLRKKASVD